jgi:hypothetical protein
MKAKDFKTIDGNEAAALVAYQLNEVIAKRLFQEAQKQVDARWQLYQQLARSGSPDKENVKV